jgi:hypothetical protein
MGVEIPEFGTRLCLYKSQLVNVMTVDRYIGSPVYIKEVGSQ